MTHVPSRSALKRAARLKQIPWQSRVVREGVCAAIIDARRAFRAGKLPSPYLDIEDFFGVRLRDSTDGRRFVAAYDEAIDDILLAHRRR
jgi:hypothetical protein